MTGKSVIFLEPAGSRANVFDYAMKLPLLGSLYLGTILHNAGHKVSIINENILGRRVSPFELKADCLCISSLTVNANRAREMALKVREVYPGTRIIAGGIHPSLVPEDFAEFADHIVTGEAEGVILGLIEGRIREKTVHGSKVADLDELPLINYSLIRGYRRMNIIPVMSSRGCPFDCSFCAVTRVFGRKFRAQSVERTIAELKNALKYFDTNRVFFYDDNFTASKRRTRELTAAIIREKLKIYWTAQTRVDIADDEEMLAGMYEAGCGGVYIGFESISDASLSALSKSQTVSDIERAIEVIHKYRMTIHGMFMLGEDNDTPESIASTLDFTVNHEIDTVQFMVMTPLPGTRLYEKMDSENRLLHKNWDYYDGMHVVFRPLSMSPAELQEASVNCYRKFYSAERVLLDSLHAGFYILRDALLWDFRNVFRYNSYTHIVRMAAQLVISRHTRQSGDYYSYLSGLLPEE